jgi:molybdenum cofactor cytidylyltransferase
MAEFRALPPIAGFVPAAGLSSRMGSAKALLRIEGAPFLSRTVRALRVGGCSPVIVSVRDPGDDIGILALTEADRVVVPADPTLGPIAGLQAALPHLDAETGGVVVLPVDHPLVSPETVRALVDASARPGAEIVLPTHQGRPGHPVFFSAAVFPELMAPSLSEGARGVVRRDPNRVRAVAVDDPGVLANLDTPEDLLRETGEEPQ